VYRVRRARPVDGAAPATTSQESMP
jgi:hypothetical protein